MGTTVTKGKKPCIWMEAGVIDYKICNHDFDCLSCDFDRAMTKTATQNLPRRQASHPPASKKAPWEKKMQERFGEHQKCHLMRSSQCYQCSFDELLEDQFDFFLAPERPKVQEVYGIQVPISSFLHRGHTWVALENAGRVRIGLDDFSHKVFGPADKIRLPEIGEEIHSDEVALALSRQGRKAPVLAPLGGIIEAVNPKVQQSPRLTHDDPYGEGWLFVVTPTSLKPDLEKMLFGQCNVAWIENESHRLLRMLESTVGVTLPSGGDIIDDVFGHYPKLGWKRLVEGFLRTA
ncbi:MAG: glycine cleavage system protein H [Desulfobaccales bacterium]